MKQGKIAFVMAALAILSSCRGNDKDAQEKTVRVKVQELKSEAVYGEQGYSGTIEELSGAELSFFSSGTIRGIYVSAGQAVHRGQLIAELDPTTMGNTVAAAQATTSQANDMVQQARTNYAQVKDVYDRMKELHDSGSLPEMKWIEAQNSLRQAETALKSAQTGVNSANANERIARKSLQDTKIYAPFSGYIASKSAEVGQTAGPGVPVVKLVDISQVKVKISVPEDDIQHIRKGSSMRIMVPALEDRPFEGKVTETGVSADPRSRTYEVKATVVNHDGQLLPGMICKAFTNHMQGSTGVFVPANLVQLSSDNKTFVWVVNGGKAVKREISIRNETSQGAQVSSGLSDGDKLIVAGQQKVSNGMKVEIVK